MTLKMTCDDWGKLDAAMRSCWECNGAHEHLKDAEAIYCPWCGKCFRRGELVSHDDENCGCEDEEPTP